MNVSFCGVTSTALRLTRRARQESCCALFRPLTSQDKPKSLPRVPFPAASIEVSEGGHVHGWGRSPSPSPLARGRAAANPIDEKLSTPYKPTQFQYRNALLRASRDTRRQAVKRSPCQPHWFYFPSAGATVSTPCDAPLHRPAFSACASYVAVRPGPGYGG